MTLKMLWLPGDSARVSNVWKSAPACFQCLENHAPDFPMFGKRRLNFSNVWKTMAAALVVLAAAGMTASAADITPVSGPLAGGNLVTISNAVPDLGDGTDITNVVVDGRNALAIPGQGSAWVSFRVPEAVEPGIVSITVQSTSVGNTTLDDFYYYNPAGLIGWMEEDWNHWQEVAPLPAPARIFGAATYRGYIYITGGVGTTTNAFRFDGTSWSRVVGPPAGRYYHGMTVRENFLYLVAGDNSGGAAQTNVYRFNGTNWTEVAGVPRVRDRHVVSTFRNNIYTVGGYPATNGVFVGNGATWADGVQFISNEYQFAGAVMSNRFYCFGGGTTGTNLVGCFDGQTWTEAATLPQARRDQAAATFEGQLYSIGGRASGDGHTNVFRYNGSTWSYAPGLPEGRNALGAAVLNHGLYAIGGQTNIVAQTNVYRYPRIVSSHGGVQPVSGVFTGGYPVVITGKYLSDGSLGDVTNVSLCGIDAAVVSVAGLTQIVVTVGAAGGPATGAVRVCSINYGETVKAAAFTYQGPTWVVLNELGLQAEQGLVQVCWQTASETYTLGFDLYREENGAWTKINAALVAAQGWPQGGIGASYCVADAGAKVDGTYRYKLVEYETTGGTREYGPFERSAWTPRVSSVVATPAGVVVQWQSRAGEFYDVLKAADARGGYAPVAANLPATPPVNAWTDPAESAAAAFYRIEAR